MNLPDLISFKVKTLSRHVFGFILFALLFLCYSCSPKIHVTGNNYNKYGISNSIPADSALLKTIQPYRDSLRAKMNVVIAENETMLLNTQPEGALGNLMADMILKKGMDQVHQPVDFCIVNFGGIRLMSLPPGNVTVGKVYELMPFDNRVVLLNIKGSTVQQLMNVAAADGGWPVSGMKYSIHDRIAVNIFIGQSPLDTGKVYSLICSDYLANGGDNCLMLKNYPQQELNVLFRDLLIIYLQELTESGKKIQPPSTGRVVNE